MDGTQNSRVNNMYPKFSFLPSSFQYSSSLNSIVAVNGSNIEILDIHLGQFSAREDLQQSGGSLKRNEEDGENGGHCLFLEEEDKLVVANQSKIGCRSTNGGEHVFLHTILNTSQVPKNGKVTVELDIVKAGLLLNGLERCLKDVSSSSTGNLNKNRSNVQEVLSLLKHLYETAVLRMKDASCPNIKWTTINLTMDHDLLLNVFNFALIMNKQKHEAELPIIGDILQRLTGLQKVKVDNMSSEKRLMFNEVDRLQTFNSWPHMNYKWALPGPMAEAGFYHPHSSTKSAYDRAMCFTCSVCLVSWESSDQPWSEHKRHSPNCPFIKGDYTENVPLHVYAATANAQELSRKTDEIICLSNTSCDNLFAAGTKEGYIVIFETFPTLKIHSEYQITVSAMKGSSKPNTSSTIPSTVPASTDSTTNTTPNGVATVDSTTNTTPNGVATVDSLSVLASEVANEALENSNLVNELNESRSECDTVEGSLDDSIADNSISEVILHGESYCLISTDANNISHSKTEDLLKEKLDVNNSNVNGDQSTSEATSGVKDKYKTIERSCKITCVAMMNDGEDKFIVAAVKINSKKSRKNKIRQKHKLSLLLYKIASVNKSNSQSNGKTLNSGVPYQYPGIPNVNPFLANSGVMYEDEFAMGSDDDYTMFDENDGSQLAVIDEYLMASKNPSANGGTQNIAVSGSEIKTGFDQEEIIKNDNLQTIYEDCTFFKYDVEKSFYHPGMMISNLYVIDGFLVAILKNENPANLEEKKKEEGDLLLVLKILSNKKQSINVELVMKYFFPANVYVKDSTLVPCKKLSSNFLINLKALHEFETCVNGNDDNKSSSAELPKSLLLFAFSDRSFMFLSIPQMTAIQIPSNCENDIHKIVFCSALSSIAVCDIEGQLILCPYTTSEDNGGETHLYDNSTVIVNEWESKFDNRQLELLTKLTNFEAVTQGCYIFFPVNWYVTRSCSTTNTSLKANVATQHMLRLSPVQMDKRLIKRTEQLDMKLSKDDFTFRMFVLVQSTVGYFEIIVFLKSLLKEDEDFSCSFFIDDTCDEKEANMNQTNHSTSEKLLNGPVLFSSVVNENKMSGRFIIFAPELINRKSLHVIVKLQRVSASSANSTPTNEDEAKPSEDLLISDVLKDVFIGVYQFKSVVPDPFYFPGCRDVLIKDFDFQSGLLKQLFTEIRNSNDYLKEGSNVKRIMELLSWIASVVISVYNEEQSFPFTGVIEDSLSSFLKCCFMNGDRSMVHSCSQILLALKRSKISSSFETSLHDALWELLPYIHNAFSSSALHWIFILLCNIMTPEKQLDDVTKLLKTLSHVSKSYAIHFTPIYKSLNTRHGLMDMVLEPHMVDSIQLNLKSGAVLENMQCKLPTLKLSTCHMPGIMEVQPLIFNCVSVSEGSKVESTKKKLTFVKTNKSKLHSSSPNNGFGMIHPMQGFGDPLSYVPQSILEQMSDTNLGEGGISGDDKAAMLFDVFQANNIPAVPSLHAASLPPPALLEQDKQSSSNVAEPTMDNSIIYKPLLMFVEKMHVASVHYAVIKFEDTVLLTDIIFPACKSLANVSIFIWKNGETQEDAELIAYSDEISKKTLVLSNIVKPPAANFMKVVLVGGDSCSLVVSLGQYYGHVKNHVESPDTHAVALKYEKEYEEVLCQYMLAVDRIRMAHIRNESMFNYLTSASLKRDYLECRQLHYTLNVLRSTISWREYVHSSKDLSMNNLPRIEDKSFNIQQLLLYGVLHCLLKACGSNVSSMTASNVGFTKDNFVSLFNHLCIYGVNSITDNALSVLSIVGSEAPWWSDALVEIFTMCYTSSSTNIMPRKRLFYVYLKLVQSSTDINGVMNKFMELLRQQIHLLLQHEHEASTMVLDWLLLLVIHILQQKGCVDWRFFSPWEYLIENTASNNPNNQSLSNQNKSWFSNVIGNTIAEKIANIKKDMGAGTSASYSSSGLKKLPKHCTPLNKKEDESLQNKLEASKDDVLATDETELQLTQYVFIEKEQAVATLRLLLDLLVERTSQVNTEQSILICQVVTLILSASKESVDLPQVITLQSIETLIKFTVCKRTNPWLKLALNLLLKHFISQKESLLISHSSKTESKVSSEITKSEETAKKMQDLIGKNFFFKTNGGAQQQMLYPHMESCNEGDTDDLLTNNCNVVHPVRSHFHALLESNANNAQQFYMTLNNNNKVKSRNKQVIKIANPQKFRIDVELTKTNSITFLLQELMKLGKYATEIDELKEIPSQMLFFLTLLKDNSIVTSEPLLKEVTVFVSLLYERIGKGLKWKFDIILTDVFKKLYKSVLSSCHHVPNVYISFIQSFNTLEASRAGKHSSEYVLVAASSILNKEGACKDESTQDSILLKTIILQLLKQRMEHVEFGEHIELFEKLEGSKEFYICSTDEEVKLVEDLLSYLLDNIHDYLATITSLLYTCQDEQFELKSTVFVMQDGRIRLCGKAHKLNNDIVECLHMVAAVKKLLSISMLPNDSDHIKHIYERIQEAFCESYQLMSRKNKKIIKYGLTLLKTCEETSLMHPLVSALLLLMYNPPPSSIATSSTMSSSTRSNPSSVLVLSASLPNRSLVILTTLIEAMKKYSNSKSYQMLEGLKVLLAHIIKDFNKNEEILKSFCERSFPVILDSIILSSKSITDEVEHSSAVQDLYSCKISMNKKRLLENDRIKKDQDGVVLQNFAPFAKIIGPSNSASPEVLLLNKSPLRRVRFAAWGHHFEECDNAWITLEILLPFHVLLRDIIIHMHSANLIGTPSEVELCLKSVCGNWVTHSPILKPGVITAIHLNLSKGVVCKDILLRLRRPNGSEHIKLNLIELFGRDIYGAGDSEKHAPQYKTLDSEVWLDMLTLLLNEWPSSCEQFLLTSDNHMLLFIQAFVKSMPHLSRLTVHHVSSMLLNTIIPQSPDFALIVIQQMMTFISKLYSLNHMQQLQPMLQLITDMLKINKDVQQNRMISYLLEWFSHYLLVESLTPLNIAIVQSFVSKIIAPLVKLKHIRSSKEIDMPNDLSRTLSNLITSKDIDDKLMQHLGLVLYLITNIKPSLSTVYLEQARKITTANVENLVERKDVSIIFAAMCCYNESDECTKNELLIIVNFACQLLKQIFVSNQTSAQPKCVPKQHIESILVIFKLFESLDHVSSEIFHWFVSEHDKSFWKPLLENLCFANYSSATHCSTMFSIQMLTISLFRRFLYLNHSNQSIFSTICSELLHCYSECSLDTTVNYSNSFIKLILLQLVICEENVTVFFESRHSIRTILSKHKCQIPLSATLTDLEDKIKSSIQYANKETINNSSKENTQEDNPNASMGTLSDCIVEAGKAAVLKRSQKLKKETATQDKLMRDAEIQFYISKVSAQPLPKKLMIGQMLQRLHEIDPTDLLTPPLLEYRVSCKKPTIKVEEEDTNLLETSFYPTTLHTFASLNHLPLLATLMVNEKADRCKRLFCLILPLPGFSKVFLQDRAKAELLLRIMLGVKQTKNGQVIQSLNIANELTTLPLKSLCSLLEVSPLTSTKGIELRHLICERNVMRVVLECLTSEATIEQEEGATTTQPTHYPIQKISTTSGATKTLMQQQQNYWAKGTGFGTGSTASNWSIEKAYKEKKKEEELLVIVFKTLSAFIEVKQPYTGEEDDLSIVMNEVKKCIAQSSLIELITSYLRNDSVLDLSRHIPLYRALLSLMHAMASCKFTLALLISSLDKQDRDSPLDASKTLLGLLTKLKDCVKTYQSKLRFPKISNIKSTKPEKPKSRLKISKDISHNSKTVVADETSEADNEELNLLLAYIHTVYEFITLRMLDYERLEGRPSHITAKPSVASFSTKASEEQQYVDEMKLLQFDTYEIVIENEDGTIKFNIPFQYANAVRTAAKNSDNTNAARARRLAQEIASLSTSLPLSYSSTVFLQCDEERLDVMKVLITGPDDTPYENGCFEFDIYFPQDYPQTPMSVNLQTTGRNTVRFNPNLYNDGKVCLSILNTWHGRPEERWNAQTSNLLQVLVSIQSLILVSDPYFNEPGYERLRGTNQGKQNSSDYNANIKQATVRWAMLEQMRRPSACFKEIIHKHFTMKKTKIISQIDDWLCELEEQSSKRKSASHSYEALKSHFADIKREFANIEKKKEEPQPQFVEESGVAIKDIPLNLPSVMTTPQMLDGGGDDDYEAMSNLYYV